MSCCRRHSNDSIKQYSTLELLCKYKDEVDEPLSLNGISIKSQMRGCHSNLIADLNITVIDSDGGVFLLSTDARELPVGTASVDIIFEKEGKRVQSDTINIEIAPSVTIP